MMKIFHLDDLGRSLGVLSRQPRYRIQHFTDENCVPFFKVRPEIKIINIVLSYWQQSKLKIDTFTAVV